jgi:hypothetical protein
MRTASIAAVIAINAYIGIRYVWLLRKGRIRPALAMWLFFTIAVAGSLVTYLSQGRFGPLDNILNTADVLMVGSVSVAIVLYGDRSSRFTRFDLGCLAAVAAILVTWGFTRQSVAAHSAIQGILVIAYAPVVRRLWRADRNTEPFAPWIGMLLAALGALLSSKGTLAAVYALRAVACTSLLMLLMWRAELRQRRHNLYLGTDTDGAASTSARKD